MFAQRIRSGFVAWVTAAFGPLWGFQEGIWSWLSGVTDNSVYAVILADNLKLFVPALGTCAASDEGGAQNDYPFCWPRK